MELTVTITRPGPEQGPELTLDLIDVYSGDHDCALADIAEWLGIDEPEEDQDFEIHLPDNARAVLGASADLEDVCALAAELARCDGDEDREMMMMAVCLDANSGLTFREFEDGFQALAQSPEAYAQEFAYEIGALPDEPKWPSTCIDWEAAADELADTLTFIPYKGRVIVFQY